MKNIDKYGEKLLSHRMYKDTRKTNRRQGKSEDQDLKMSQIKQLLDNPSFSNFKGKKMYIYPFPFLNLFKG
jgi:hypothetical protein